MKEFQDWLKKQFTPEHLFGLLVASAGIGYFLLSWDLIPDTMWLVGYFDDVVLIVFAAAIGRWAYRTLFGKKKR